MDKVYFESKNFQVPFYGLCNLSLEYDNSIEDIDFLLITNQFYCILNFKILGEGIELDKQGNFSGWEKMMKNGLRK